ncbi:hypothetical protein EDB80DRAFT_835338 [Ilyonectria destructans]|nr:hypothetical protein EDB80DRAFT_835338 [Ilyonectria destructans]
MAKKKAHCSIDDTRAWRKRKDKAVNDPTESDSVTPRGIPHWDRSAADADLRAPNPITTLATYCTGKKRLKILAHSDFRGGFLCDAVGLGKSLTALATAMELREKMLPYCGFILVVCRSGCMVQSTFQKWGFNSVATLFSSARCATTQRKLQRDRHHIWETARPGGHADLQHQCDEIKKHYKKLCAVNLSSANDAYYSTVHSFSIDIADKLFQSPPKRIHAPLHLSLYGELNQDIICLIVDESHNAKNEDSQLNRLAASLEQQIQHAQ